MSAPDLSLVSLLKHKGAILHKKEPKDWGAWLWVQRKGRQVFVFARKGLESVKHTMGRTSHNSSFVINT